MVYDICSLCAANGVAQHFIRGALQKASSHKISPIDKCLQWKLSTLEHFKKAVKVAEAALGIDETSECHAQFCELKESASGMQVVVFNSISQHTEDIQPKFRATLLRSLVDSEDDKLAFWPAKFSSTDFFDRASAMPADEEVLETTISLAQARGQQLEVVKLQCLAHSDRAQRALLAFRQAMSTLKPVSSTELKDLDFERDAAKKHNDADNKVGALRTFMFPLEQSHRASLEEELKVKELLSGVTTEMHKASTVMTERWEVW